ncbi:MAG: hypothetical protein ABMB14_40710 [Myxococcota bacterium]
MLAREWVRCRRTEEPPRVDRVEVTPLMPDLGWLRDEAAGDPAPAWLVG